MIKTKKENILFVIKELMYAQEQASMNQAFAQIKDTIYMEPRDEYLRKVQFNLALLADSLEIPRKEMPYLHEDYWKSEIDSY